MPAQFIYHFLPHPHKKERAKLLSHKALSVYCLAVLVLFAFFKIAPRFLPGVLGYASNINTKDLFVYANKERGKAGLNDLKKNDSLSKAAQNKAKDMFANGYWAHVSPDGTEPWDFILAQNYDYSRAGENLAKNFNSSKEVVEAWYQSPSHRENLLNKNYTDVGYAVVDGVLDGYETTLVVQFFGTPRNPSYLAAVDTEPTAAQVVKNPVELPSVLNSSLPKASTVPTIDIAFLSRTFAVVFGGYLGLLLLLDIWYSKLKGIPKFTGHTFAHFAFLLLAVFGMWFALAPGKIL